MAGTRRQAQEEARQQIQSLRSGTAVGEECPYHARQALDGVNRELGDALEDDSGPAPLSLLIAARHRGVVLGLRSTCNRRNRAVLDRIAARYGEYLDE